MLDILVRACCYIAIIVLGYVLRRKGVFGEETFGVVSKLVVTVTLPAALISSSAGRTIDAGMLTIVLLGFGCGVVYILAALLVWRRAEKEWRAFAVMNTPGYNIGTFALPFTQSFLGSMGVITTSLFDVGNAFICLGGAFGVASSVKDGSGISLKRIGRSLLHSIPFLTHILVTVLNLCSLTLPGPILSFAEIVGNANPFLAMLMIGVGFKLSGERSQLGSIVKLLSVRYLLAVVIALVFYFLLPFELEVRQALVLLAFSPIGSIMLAFTAELKGDVGLASAINSISIVISIVITVVLLMVML